MFLSGLSTGPDYLAGANARTLTIAMCETREAIGNLPAILDVPGIDGILVGPADLSIALANGASLDPMGSAVTAALKEILQLTLGAGKIPCAFAGSAARAKEMLTMGYKLASIGYDGMVIAEAFTRVLAEARS